MIITAVLVMIVFAAAADQLNTPGVKVNYLRSIQQYQRFHWPGLRTPRHRAVHHHVSPVRDPLHRLQHEPGQEVSAESCGHLCRKRT